MGVVTDERREILRLGGIGGPIAVEGRAGGPNAGIPAVIRRKPGVLVFEDIPPGLIVHGRIAWPAFLIDEDTGSRAVGTGAAGIPQPYRFEHAVPPDVTLPGGAVVPRSVKRFLIPSAAAVGGPVTNVQNVPQFAPFAPVQEGTLFQHGKLEHAITMPGLAASERQEHLRFRWVGASAVVGATLLTAAGEDEAEDITWANDHVNLAPGSIEITLPTGGGILRDDGKGRLVTRGDGATVGDGVVDYQTGAFRLSFAVTQTGAVLVDYEHDCAYNPLRVVLNWDALLAE